MFCVSPGCVFGLSAFLQVSLFFWSLTTLIWRTNLTVVTTDSPSQLDPAWSSVHSTHTATFRERIHTSFLLLFRTFRIEVQRNSLSRLSYGFSAVYPGRFCGSVPPGRVLMSNSQNATLLFSSDINQAGSGFVVRHRALWGRADPGETHKMKHTATHISAECIAADPYRSVKHIRYRLSIYSSVKKKTTQCLSNLEVAAENVTAPTENQTAL